MGLLERLFLTKNQVLGLLALQVVAHDFGDLACSWLLWEAITAKNSDWIGRGYFHQDVVAL